MSFGGDQNAQAVALATEQLQRGVHPSQVYDHLVGRGIDAKTAEGAIRSLISGTPQNTAPGGGFGTGNSGTEEAGLGAGLRNMLIGGLVALAGIGITVGSYLFAGEGGGYFITYGLVIFGGIQFFRGLGQAVSG